MIAGMETVLASYSSALPQGAAPERVLILPRGTFSTEDGRGPFLIDDAAAVIAASLPAGARLPIDQDHATDLAAPKGGAAPARGWIVALSAEADGIWAQVEWNPAGRALLEGREYRAISPVFLHDKTSKRITKILRASLTNNPALGERLALFSETKMDELKKALLGALGLSDDVSDEALVAAVKAMREERDTAKAAMSKVAKAAGAAEGASADAVVTLLAARGQAGNSALETQIATLQAELLSLKGNAARDAAIAKVDAAITAGKPIKAERESWIELFVSSPQTAEKTLAGLPTINGGNRVVPPTGGTDAEGLTDSERQMVQQLQLKPEDFLKQKKVLAAKQEGF